MIFLQIDDCWNHDEAFSKLCRCLVLFLYVVHDNVLSYGTENNLFLFLFFFSLRLLLRRRYFALPSMILNFLRCRPSLIWSWIDSPHTVRTIGEL